MEAATDDVDVYSLWRMETLSTPDLGKFTCVSQRCKCLDGEMKLDELQELLFYSVL